MSMGLFLTKDDEREAEIRFVAEANGHKFIKLRLNPRKLKRTLRDTRISGVRSIVGYFGGTDETGQQSISVAVKGGDLLFKFDRQERAHIGWMLDDVLPGRHSAIGYNRDFLASHAVTGWEESRFHIDERDPHSKSVKVDVEKRIKALAAKIASVAEEKELEKTMTIDEIDDQMSALLSKKEQLVRTLVPEEARVGNHKATGQLDPA